MCGESRLFVHKGRDARLPICVSYQRRERYFVRIHFVASAQCPFCHLDSRCICRIASDPTLQSHFSLHITNILLVSHVHSGLIAVLLDNTAYRPHTQVSCLHIFIRISHASDFGNIQSGHHIKRDRAVKGSPSSAPSTSLTFSMAIESSSDHDDAAAVVRAKRRIAALEQEVEVLRASNKRVKPYVFGLFLT